MSTPLPLRRRVALALTALGFLLSALFAAATIAVTEDYEHVLASEILRGQAEDYGLRLSNGLPAQLPPQVKRLIKRADRVSAWMEAVRIAGFSIIGFSVVCAAVVCVVDG